MMKGVIAIAIAAVIYTLPDQSGRMTIVCYGTPPAHECDWKKHYCVCDNTPIGYGY